MWYDCVQYTELFKEILGHCYRNVSALSFIQGICIMKEIMK